MAVLSRSCFVAGNEPLGRRYELLKTRFTHAHARFACRYYSKHMIGSRTDQRVLLGCLKWKLPKLHKHFVDIGVAPEDGTEVSEEASGRGRSALNDRANKRPTRYHQGSHATFPSLHRCPFWSRLLAPGTCASLSTASPSRPPFESGIASCTKAAKSCCAWALAS